MHEIEVKILEIDPVAVAAKLTDELGFQEYSGGEYRAIYLENMAGDLGKSGRLLRLRKEGDKAVMAYKRNISRKGAKVMEEHQTEVSDFESTLRILIGLGYAPVSETIKTRRVFRKEKVEVVFDDYKGELAHIPVFLEIEAPDEATLEKYVLALGFEKSQGLSWDTYDLVQHYADRQ